jgi:hypothetical protein
VTECRESKARQDYCYHHSFYVLTEDLRSMEEDGFDITLSDGRLQRCILVVEPVILDWKEMRLSMGHFGSAQSLFPHGHLHTPILEMGKALLWEKYPKRTDVEHMRLLLDSRKPGYAACVSQEFFKNPCQECHRLSVSHF